MKGSVLALLTWAIVLATLTASGCQGKNDGAPDGLRDVASRAADFLDVDPDEYIMFYERSEGEAVHVRLLKDNIVDFSGLEDLCKMHFPSGNECSLYSKIPSNPQAGDVIPIDRIDNFPIPTDVGCGYIEFSYSARARTITTVPSCA